LGQAAEIFEVAQFPVLRFLGSWLTLIVRGGPPSNW
jgi:hypothetical protein